MYYTPTEYVARINEERIPEQTFFVLFANLTLKVKSNCIILSMQSSLYHSRTLCAALLYIRGHTILN
jgi:hypothetical protein